MINYTKIKSWKTHVIYCFALLQTKAFHLSCPQSYVAFGDRYFWLAGLAEQETVNSRSILDHF